MIGNELKERENESSAVNPAYAKVNPNLPAEFIYFYYLEMPKDQKASAKGSTQVFVFDRKRHIPPHKMQGEIERILGEIRRGEHTPCGWNIGDVKWRRKSYLVFVLDDAQHKLEACNAVEFRPKDGGHNHSFHDGQDIIPPDQKATGFFCLNHMKDRSGNDEFPDPEHYCVRVNHSHRTAGPDDRRSHEDTGTNMGPPVPPP